MPPGFVIHVRLDDHVAQAAGVDADALLGEVERALTRVPGASTLTSVVVAAEPPATEPGPPIPSTVAPTSGVVVDRARHRVSVDGRVVALSFREHALLAFLLEHPGEVHDRRRLLTALARESNSEIGERTIDVYLQRLRRRLDPYGDIVRTVRGRGYRLDPHPDLTVLPAA